jgi:hypothetical protein
LNRICSIGSYNCFLEIKGDRHRSLVDESGLLDQSVINGPDLSFPRDPVAVEDRSQLVSAFWGGSGVV